MRTNNHSIVDKIVNTADEFFSRYPSMVSFHQ